MQKQEFMNNKNEIDIQNGLASGIYFLEIDNDKGENLVFQKIFIE